MKLSEIIDLQKEFDSQHKGRFRWDQPIDRNNTELLEYLLIGLIGEVGELANIIKKIHRGDIEFDDQKNNLSEELIDIFIYILKLSYQCNINLEEEYLKKLDKNKLRFKKFENKAKSDNDKRNID